MSKHKHKKEYQQLSLNRWYLMAFLTMLEKYRKVLSQPVAEIIKTVGPMVNYQEFQVVNNKMKRWTSPVQYIRRLKKLGLLSLYLKLRIPKLQVLNWWYRRHLRVYDEVVTITVERRLVTWLVSLSGILLEDTVLLTAQERKVFFKILNEINSKPRP